MVSYPLFFIIKATSTTYAIRGGYSGNGVFCGFAFVILSNHSGAISWSHGAAISFKSIYIIFIKVQVLVILIVVVAVVLVFIVVSLVLIWVVRFLGTAGVMAPPYHLNYVFFIVIILLKVVIPDILYVVVPRTLVSIVVFFVLVQTTTLVVIAGILAPLSFKPLLLL